MVDGDGEVESPTPQRQRLQPPGHGLAGAAPSSLVADLHLPAARPQRALGQRQAQPPPGGMTQADIQQRGRRQHEQKHRVGGEQHTAPDEDLAPCTNAGHRPKRSTVVVTLTWPRTGCASIRTAAKRRCWACMASAHSNQSANATLPKTSFTCCASTSSTLTSDLARPLASTWCCTRGRKPVADSGGGGSARS